MEHRRTRREPRRSDFATEAEFVHAHAHWQEFRAKQKESVNRSREKAKREAYLQDVQIRLTEHENNLLAQRIVELRASIDMYREMLQRSATGVADIDAALDEIGADDDHVDSSVPSSYDDSSVPNSVDDGSLEFLVNDVASFTA